MESNPKILESPDGFDARQKEILFNYFRTHPYLMLGNFTETKSFSKEDRAVLWFQLAQKLNNATPEFSERSWRHWEQLWNQFSQELHHKLILTELEFNLLELLKRAKTLPFEQQIFSSNWSQPLAIKKHELVAITIDSEVEPGIAEKKETSEDPNKVERSVKNDDKQTGLQNTPKGSPFKGTKLTTLGLLDSNETNKPCNKPNEIPEDVSKNNSEPVKGIAELQQKMDETKEKIKCKETRKADENRPIWEKGSIVTRGQVTENEFGESESTDIEMNEEDAKPEIQQQFEALLTNNPEVQGQFDTITDEEAASESSGCSQNIIFLNSAATLNQDQPATVRPCNVNHKGKLSNMEKALIKKFIKSDLIKMKYLKRKLKMENEYHKRKLTLMRDLLLLKKRKIKVEETQATALLRISRSLHRLVQNPRSRPEEQ